MRILATFDKVNKNYWLVIGIVMIAIVGVLDYLTGPSLTFAAFYVIPIALVTWQTGRRLEIIVALLSVFVWLLAIALSGGPLLNSEYYILNTLIEFISLIAVTILISEFRNLLEHEKNLSQTDYLTGAMNSRSFYHFMQMEVRRSSRYKHPFTIIYFDVDNFKALNDRFGHMIGDDVLRTIVQCAKKRLRRTDVIARLGGDEFAILLPESSSSDAQVVLTKVICDIAEGMQTHKWDATLSVGVLTCAECIDSQTDLDEIIKTVDNLMYSVKRNGKNSTKYADYVGKIPN